jgi:hypothetical protein
VIDLSGQKFNKLTVIERSSAPSKNGVKWLCICDCGNKRDVLGAYLRSGSTKSCGCLSRENFLKNQRRPQIIDLVGQKYGRLSVVSMAGRNNSNQVVWNCICECGKATIVPGNSLRTGHTSSCGCYSLECSKRRTTTHGLSEIHRYLYERWESMKGRCYNSNSKSFRNYGGRGIYVCDEWKDDPKAFIEWGLRNGWVRGLHLDRIDNDGPYAPWNCRFISAAKNNLNKRDTVYVEHNGTRIPFKQLYDELGSPVVYTVALGRLRKAGWDPVAAIKTPLLW